MTSRPDAGRAGVGADAGEGAAAAPVVAVVRDLFFLARIRETARLVGVPLEIVRSAEDAERRAAAPARLVVVDLTGGFDYARLFAALERAPGAAVLGFTTHALARQTQPWHARCRRVVTKEALTRELPTLLREGLAA